jgi:aldose 1-epimerase
MKHVPVAIGCAVAAALMVLPSQSPAAPPAKPAALAPGYVELDARNFQKSVDGLPVDLYTLRNRNGVVVKITNYGAKVEQILVPDRDGRLGDIAQGYETLDQVRDGQGSMGAFIGRYANRIAGGRFTLDGVEYKLAINDISTDPKAPRENTLHGGKRGSRFIPFDARQLAHNSVQMSVLFKDGEEGFPGDLPVRVVYTLTDANELVIAYDAVAVNKKTVANFTGHTFFNLSGDLGSSIEPTVITVNSSKVLEVTPQLAPNGKLRDVTGTPMDFRKPKPFAKDINADYDLLKAGGGYDNHYVIDEKASGEFRMHARAYDPRSGRILEVWSTEPGVQLYSGNFLDGRSPRDVGKGKTVYQFRSGFCIEPSHFPDSPNHANFPSTTIKPGDWYSGRIVYRFLTDKPAKAAKPTTAARS